MLHLDINSFIQQRLRLKQSGINYEKMSQTSKWQFIIRKISHQRKSRKRRMNSTYLAKKRVNSVGENNLIDKLSITF